LRYKGLTKKKIEEAKDSIELWKGLIGLIKGEIEKKKLKVWRVHWRLNWGDLKPMMIL
jgi:hypothetical protein